MQSLVNEWLKTHNVDEINSEMIGRCLDVQIQNGQFGVRPLGLNDARSLNHGCTLTMYVPKEQVVSVYSNNEILF